MKRIPTILLLMLTTLTLGAQKLPTLDDLMWGGSAYWSHQPRYIQTAWWGDVLAETDVDAVSALSDSRGRLLSAPDTLFRLEDVQAALTETDGRLHSLQGAGFPEDGKTVVSLSAGRVRFHYDWTTRSVVRRLVLPEGVRNVHTAPGLCAASYLKDDNLYVLTASGIETQISSDGSRQIVYGQSVHRDEFGIHDGQFWSPRGSRLAFYRMDQSMVSDFPLVDNSARVAELRPEAYPMAGMTSHKVSVGICDLQTGRTVYLQTADPTDRYFTNIAWSPDEKTVYMFELPRSQRVAELTAYSAETGEKLGVIYREENDKYVEPQQPIRFLPWDETKFVMFSRRDGYNHLYLFDRSGRELSQLTSGPWEVLALVGFDSAKKSLVIASNEAAPVGRNHYSVNLRTGRRTLLDNGRGQHRGVLSASGALLCDTWSAHDSYRRRDIVSTRRVSAPVTFDSPAAPYAGYAMPRVESGTIKAADGQTDLYYRLVLPVGFDPTEKYPTVVYVYGGPHAHNVDDSWQWAMRPWEAYMAGRGYIIFVVDNRGSENRGAAFEQATWHRLGQVEMEDQMAGVDFLRTLPYVDTDRLGVHGWSFGGFMTTNLICSHPDVFKVGVAGGPVIDWKLYEVMYGERYMGTPEENPEGYAQADLTKKAADLKGRLQIIVGYNDPTCVMQHSLSFLRAAADAGTQPDYFVYPGQGHNMMGRDMVHLHERITRYFDDYLK